MYGLLLSTGCFEQLNKYIGFRGPEVLAIDGQRIAEGNDADLREYPDDPCKHRDTYVLLLTQQSWFSW